MEKTIDVYLANIKPLYNPTYFSFEDELAIFAKCNIKSLVHHQEVGTLLTVIDPDKRNPKYYYRQTGWDTDKNHFNGYGMEVEIFPDKKIEEQLMSMGQLKKNLKWLTNIVESPIVVIKEDERLVYILLRALKEANLPFKGGNDYSHKYISLIESI